MDSVNSAQASRLFGSALAQALSTAFSERLGSAWTFQLDAETASAPQVERPVGYRIKVDGGLRGDCAISLDQQQVAKLAAKLLGEEPSAFEQKHGEAVLKILSSSMGEFADTLIASYGTVTCSVEVLEDTADDKRLVSLTGSSDDGGELVVSLSFNDELLDAMGRPVGVNGSGAAKKPGVDATNLQLVMDVELNVSLRFGQCQLPLREVLDLASGSVIELDRDVDDPVELLLDGKVIARGEAVIVDGNYGLRVTEIPEPLASHFGG